MFFQPSPVTLLLSVEMANQPHGS